MTVAAAFGQSPDVNVRIDARLDYRTLKDGAASIRWYDPLCRPSLVALSFVLEPGVRLFASERFSKIPHDGDTDQLDEAYIESRGAWKAGKQFLPFGKQFLVRESAVAVQSDNALGFLSFPAQAAVCDAGQGRQRGVAVRLGSNVGVSAMVGDHFGISATTLSVIHNTDEAKGVGEGYHQIYGADYTQKLGDATSTIEFATFRAGQTALDQRDSVLDWMLEVRPDKYKSFYAGLTRAFDSSTTSVRIGGSIYAFTGTRIEPFLRFRDGNFFDAAVTVRVKF